MKDILYYATISLAAIFGLITVYLLIIALTPLKVKLERAAITRENRYRSVGLGAATAAVAAVAIGVLVSGWVAPSASSQPRILPSRRRPRAP